MSVVRAAHILPTGLITIPSLADNITLALAVPTTSLNPSTRKQYFSQFTAYLGAAAVPICPWSNTGADAAMACPLVSPSIGDQCYFDTCTFGRIQLPVGKYEVVAWAAQCGTADDCAGLKTAGAANATLHFCVDEQGSWTVCGASTSSVAVGTTKTTASVGSRTVTSESATETDTDTDTESATDAPTGTVVTITKSHTTGGGGIVYGGAMAAGGSAWDAVK
ncbi:hypothetical protein HK101_007529, partial [Irineochytrium annulatum]